MTIRVVGSKVRDCRCPAAVAARYRGRVSGPLLDRFDLRLEVKPVDPDLLLGDGGADRDADLPALARARAAQVDRAHRLGLSRPFNARIPPGVIRGATSPTREAELELARLARAHALSGRGVHRTLRFARTIADLAGSEPVEAAHVREAHQYRGETGQGAGGSRGRE